MRNLILISVLIVILAAFFASSHPDGLEKVAEILGFINKGMERGSIMTDYSIPFISQVGLSTAAAGIVGVLIILGIFSGTAVILRRRASRT